MMKTRLRAKAGMGVAAVLMMGAMGVAAAPQAAAAPADCPREYVCVWNNDTASGKPTWKSKGNLYDLRSEKGVTIVNNGVRKPGADHIWYNLTTTPENGGNFKGCLHYPNDTNMVTFEGPVTLHSARWGREC